MTNVEYIEITDPEYYAALKLKSDEDSFLVQPKNYSSIPIKDPSWKPQPCCLPVRFRNIQQRIESMEVRQDDIWVVSYPKSGSTWTQEMLWLICNNLNYETAKSIKLPIRYQFLETDGVMSLKDNDTLKQLSEMLSPRFIKSHLPVSLLPEQIWTAQPKMLYVHRNPKAVTVSFYHHMATLRGYRGTMADFVRSTVRDLQWFAPYHQHVIEYNELAYLDNVLIITYEEMKKNLRSVVEKVCTFVGKEYNDDQIKKLLDHLSFESMRNNTAVNNQQYIEKVLAENDRSHELGDPNRRFIRKGKVDGWKEELSQEMADDIDAWTKRKVTSANHLKLFM